MLKSPELTAFIYPFIIHEYIKAFRSPKLFTHKVTAAIIETSNNISCLGLRNFWLGWNQKFIFWNSVYWFQWKCHQQRLIRIKSKKMRWKEDIKWSIEPKFFITSKKVLFGADLARVPDNKVGTPCPLIIVTAKHSLSLFPLGTDTKSSPVVETHPSIPTTEHSVHNTKWSVNNMKIWNLSSIFICVVFKSGPVGPRSAICKVRRVFLIFKMTLFLVRAVGQSREQRGICLASSLSLQHK